MFWSLSHETYDNITVCSLGTLVICGVAGASIFLGVSQSGSLWSHTQVRHNSDLPHDTLLSHYQDHDNFSLLDADTWSGLTWLSLAGLGSLVSGLMLAWSCVGKQITGTERRYRVKM